MAIEEQIIQKALQQAQSKREFQRVLCVWLKLALGLDSGEIAAAIGWKADSVRKVQSRFVREGIQSFRPKGRGGRKRENISLAREKKILDKFVRQARRGSVLNMSEIRSAYELSAGKPVSRSTVYRLIERHGLRRYLPRARRSQWQSPQV